jgi:hypothetical protein
MRFSASDDLTDLAAKMAFEVRKLLIGLMKAPGADH